MSLQGLAITKRWWELFFVRNLSRVLLLALALYSWGMCYDSPVASGFGVWNAPEGLPGWYSTPARLPGTSVGVSGFMRSGDMGEWSLSAAGEWGFGDFRGAFLYGYYSLDSLYRQTDVMLELSASRWFLIAGAGAGAYAEWLLGDAAWVRYRVKAGVSARAMDVTLSVWWTGFTDEHPDYPWIGTYIRPSETFTAFAYTDWKAVTVGTLLSFTWGKVETSYVFPNFGFSLGVSFGFAGYGLGIGHGSSGSIPDWNSAWLSKVLK